MGSRQKQQGRTKSVDTLMEELDVWTCEVCQKDFNQKDDKVCECEYCNKHYCTKCIGMKDSEYNHLKKAPGMWFCPKCEGKVIKVLKENKTIEEICAANMEKINQRLDDIDRLLKSKCNEDQVKKIIAEEIKPVKEDEVRRIVAAEIKPVKEDEVKRLVAEEFKQVRETIQQEIKGVSVCKNRDEANTVIQEIQGMKSRENNIIIHRLKESTSVTKAGTAEHDTEALTGLFDLLETDIRIDEDIEDQGQIRLGSKGETSMRPLLVKFKLKEKKTAFMRSLYKLRQNREHTLYGNIGVAHDMSKEEREIEKS